jgi:hypothetical protein
MQSSSQGRTFFSHQETSLQSRADRKRHCCASHADAPSAGGRSQSSTCLLGPGFFFSPVGCRASVDFSRSPRRPCWQTGTKVRPLVCLESSRALLLLEMMPSDVGAVVPWLPDITRTLLQIQVPTWRGALIMPECPFLCAAPITEGGNATPRLVSDLKH